jgi:SAM-dependent methyltransferase
LSRPNYSRKLRRPLKIPAIIREATLAVREPIERLLPAERPEKETWRHVSAHLSGAASSFDKYAAYYDLLYQDKDYEAEAEYVARTIHSITSAAGGILEFGSGTGRHGRLLAALGFNVHGVECSAEMVARAHAAARASPVLAAGSFTCEVGDIRSIDLGRTFDAVIALFHVISYQTTNKDLEAVFGIAARHLKLGGVFLFDVWHGPAVLMERPTQRIKRVADDRFEVTRRARPEFNINQNVVKVTYEMQCREHRSGEVAARFSEEHVMRYLFPTEIDLLARACGMSLVMTEEFMTGRSPSASTWGVTYLLQKQSVEVTDVPN